MASDTLGKHGHGIGEETGKGHGGAYKLRISYQVMGADRGDRVGAGRADSQRGGTEPTGWTPWTARQTTATSVSTLNA